MERKVANDGTRTIAQPPEEVTNPTPITAPTNAITSGVVAPTAAVPPISPSFDYDAKTKKPNLLEGETIICESMKYGFPVIVTSNARKIFICTFAEFAAAGFTLPLPIEEFAAFFPQAVS